MGKRRQSAVGNRPSAVSQKQKHEVRGLKPSRVIALIVGILLLGQLANAQVAVTTYRYDNGRTGQNVNEAVLTPSNVNVNSFGKLFSYSLPSDSYVYAQPLYLPNVNIPGAGLRNVLYIATEHDIVYAFDADGLTSTPYWQVDLAARVGGTTVATSSATNDDYLGPNLGVSSTPVIDQSTGTMYVVSNTLENGNRVQRLQALDVTTGAPKFGGSVVIQGSASGVTFDPSIQNQRPALLLANGNIYVAWGAYGDNGPYHGWIMAYNASNLAQVAVYCTTPNGTMGSNWMLGSLTSDQEGNIYTVTGNGSVDGNGDHGESVIKVSPTLSPINGFTPSNWGTLNNNDWDLGGGGLLQLPDQAGTATTPHLAVLAGKEGTLYLLNRDDLGQFAGANSGTDHVVQEFPGEFSQTPCNVDGECNFQTPAYWNNNVYFAAANHPLQVLQLNNGQFTSSTPTSQGSTQLGAERGASPMVSANGTSNGIVWVLRVDDASSSAPSAILFAYDATNAANKLYSSDQNSGRDSPGQAQFFIVPVVANGKVYVATRSQVSVYGLLAYSNAQAPTIQFGVNPTSGGAPLTVTASTSGSTDPNSGGNIVSSWIDFGDGTVVNATTANHTYGNTGTYTVVATVYGSSGKSARTTTSVSVSSQPPAAVSVSPSSGIGMSQTFTYQFSDPSGYTSIRWANTIINSRLSYASSCSTYYQLQNNGLYLINDAGSAWQGPVTPGANATLQNSQCMLNAAQSSVSGSGNNLAVSVALSFASTFVGVKTNYAVVQDLGGANSGIQVVGTWTVGSSTPTVSAVSVSPSSGAGTSQVFTYQYSDSNGYGSIAWVNGIINSRLSYAGSCSTYYQLQNNGLYLINDEGNAWQGPITPGTNTTLQNSQCILNAAQSSASGTGNNLTIAVSLSFASGFAGKKNNYAVAQDVNGTNSGVQTLGTWTVGVAVSPQSVTPESGTGTNQTFTYQYSDTNGYKAIAWVNTIINSQLSYAGSCSTYYQLQNNGLYLINDAGSTWQGPITPGTNTTLQNSQCTLNAAQSSASGSGNNLTVAIALSFASGFSGSKNNYAVAQDVNGTNSGVQTLGTWTVGTPAVNSISHVFFMLQENHSFDNYFGRMGQYRADKGFTDSFDGVPLSVSYQDANGNAVSPYHLATVCTEDLAPGWDPTHLAVDGGAMDRFPLETQNYLPSSIDSGGRRSMGYYDWTDLPYYYELAFQFGTSDRYFSSVLTRTIPNRMYMFAATSFGHINNDSPPGGGWTQATIFDRLDAAGIKWRIYRVDETNSLADWSVYARDSGKVFPISQYFTDVKSESTTPQVVFIDRGGGSSGLDEHPGNDVQSGAAEVAKIINALLASPSWHSSAFFLSWDEPGGFYDHVAPVAMTKPDNIAPMLSSGSQPGDFAHSGLRVPVVVVSPWVKPHFVSHVVRDHTSILKFIETRFNLQPLTSRDANADNMLEFFDFSTPHLATPPSLPSQPTSGTCDAGSETTNS